MRLCLESVYWCGRAPPLVPLQMWHGQYSFNVPKTLKSLSFPFIGFESQTWMPSGRSYPGRIHSRGFSAPAGEVGGDRLRGTAPKKNWVIPYSPENLKTMTSANDFNWSTSLSRKIAGVNVPNSGSQVGAFLLDCTSGETLRFFLENQPLFGGRCHPYR